MKLVINAVGINMGGGKVHVENLTKWLCRVNPDWQVILFCSSSIEIEHIANLIMVRKNITGARRIAWDLFGCYKFARENEADGMISLGNFGPIIGNVPSVLYQCNSLSFDKSWIKQVGIRRKILLGLKRLVAALCIMRAKVIVTPSSAMREYLQNWNYVPKNKPIMVVPHGLAEVSCAYLPDPSNEIHFISLGHGAPHKNQLMMVPVMAKLAAEGFDVYLDITVSSRDDPSYFHLLEEKIADLRLVNRVKLIGNVDRSTMLRGYKAMIIPSKSESFCLPVLEGMAARIPLIVSNIPALKELLNDSAWYFDPNSEESLYLAIMSFLHSDNLMKGIKLDKAFERSNAYNWETNAKLVSQIVSDYLLIA